MSPVQNTGRQDDDVGVAALRQLREHELRVEQRRRRVSRAELLGALELEGDGVDRDDVARSAMRAPWIAPEPTPPHPATTTVSPGLTLARSTTEPKPVEIHN